MAGIGYPDYQRVVNWDGPTVLHNVAVKEGTNYTSEWINCSRYSNIKLFIPAIGSGVEGIVTVHVAWRADEEDETTSAGEVSMCIAPSTEGPNSFWSLTLPNRAGWVRVKMVWQRTGLEVSSYKLSVSLDNRQNAIAFPISEPELITFIEPKLKGSEGTHVYPNYYYAGDVTFSVIGAEAGQALVVLQAMRPTGGTWQDVAVWGSTNAYWTVLKMYVPYSAWRVELYNISATEKSIGVMATPSVSAS